MEKKFKKIQSISKADDKKVNKVVQSNRNPSLARQRNVPDRWTYQFKNSKKSQSKEEQKI